MKMEGGRGTWVSDETCDVRALSLNTSPNAKHEVLHCSLRDMAPIIVVTEVFNNLLSLHSAYFTAGSCRRIFT
jgi:hypothetical protein